MSADNHRPHDTNGAALPADVFEEILALRGDTVAWWRQTAVFGQQLTTELAALVRAGTCTIDAANEILVHAGLLPLPEPRSDPHDPTDPDAPADRRDDSAPAPTWPSLADHLALALAERDRAQKRCRSTARRIRNALILAVEDGVLTPADLGRSGDDQDLYRLVDRLLRRLGLPGLATVHQYTVSATIELHVIADDSQGARQIAWQRIHSRLPSASRRGPRITIADRHSLPDITWMGPGRFRVRWHTTFLVSLPGAHSAALAEQAVRDRTAGDGMDTSTTVTYLGERIDPRLRPDRDGPPSPRR